MNIRTIAWYELKRLSRHRTVLFNLFLLPMLLIFILGTALSSFFGAAEDVELKPLSTGLVISGSTGDLPASFEAFIENPEIASMLNLERSLTRAEAESRLRSGELEFVVVVPDHLDDRMFSGGSAELELLLGKDSVQNLVGESLFGSYMDEANSRQALFMTAAAEGQGGDSVSITERPAYVNAGQLGGQGESYSAVQYYAASMMIMFLLNSGMMVSSSLYSEKEDHTLYRLQSMPLSGREIFGGKILGCSLITFAQAGIIILGSNLLYGVNWGNHVWLLILVCVLISIASMTIAAVVSLMTSSAATASGIIQAVIIAMTFLSGGFTPLPVDIIRTLGEFTVNHWALQGILRMMLGAGTSEVLACVGILGAISLGLTAAALIVYRKVGYSYHA
ncbi:ABC transporter permease [Paenibacillus lemnae]|uniref:ABC transporter permease n=1 Tax=Paenibacillus lemnae TaxID=1330551 RepID=A0A848M8U2_PAELE|nr:ABC transporter permease [Paenibacillus lemnae]NMO96679.1 ABC transporter permease [Paenibacillus lemnae]